MYQLVSEILVAIVAWGFAGGTTASLCIQVTPAQENDALYLSGREFRGLLATASREQLEQLIDAESIPVAVHAAWKHVAKGIREGRRDGDLSKFFEVIERRLRVSPPDWWKSVAESVHLDREGTERLEFDVQRFHPYVESEVGLFVPHATTVERDERGNLVVVVSRDDPFANHDPITLKPPEHAFSGQHPSLTVNRVLDRIFVTFHSDYREPSIVYECLPNGQLDQVARYC